VRRSGTTGTRSQGQDSMRCSFRDQEPVGAEAPPPDQVMFTVLAAVCLLSGRMGFMWTLEDWPQLLVSGWGGQQIPGPGLTSTTHQLVSLSRLEEGLFVVAAQKPADRNRFLSEPSGLAPPPPSL